MHPNEPKLVQSVSNNQLKMSPEFDALFAQAAELGLAYLEAVKAQVERQMDELA